MFRLTILLFFLESKRFFQLISMDLLIISSFVLNAYLFSVSMNSETSLMFLIMIMVGLLAATLASVKSYLTVGTVTKVEKDFVSGINVEKLHAKPANGALRRKIGNQIGRATPMAIDFFSKPLGILVISIFSIPLGVAPSIIAASIFSGLLVLISSSIISVYLMLNAEKMHNNRIYGDLGSIDQSSFLLYYKSYFIRLLGLSLVPYFRYLHIFMVVLLVFVFNSYSGLNELFLGKNSLINLIYLLVISQLVGAFASSIAGLATLSSLYVKNRKIKNL